MLRRIRAIEKQMKPSDRVCMLELLPNNKYYDVRLDRIYNSLDEIKDSSVIIVDDII